MNRRSVCARLVFALLLGYVAILSLSGCRAPLYYYSEYQYAGRAIPPSGLQQRVLATYTNGGSGGGAEILDGLRDLRGNIQNTHPTFFITGYSTGTPQTIINYPEQQTGYVFDPVAGTIASLNYAKESGNGTVASFGANSPSAAAAQDGTRFIGTTATSGQLVVSGVAGTVALNLPNVNQVVMNQGDTILLAMTRNSNALYRVVQLPQTGTPVTPPGSIDCEPLLLPVYCVVPVGGSYDRPTNAYFSLDGKSAYILNCGPECGGTTASVAVLQAGALAVNSIPAVDPLSDAAPSPLQMLPVANPVPIPGGVTAALSDGTNLYLSGQSLFGLTPTGALSTTPRADGLFTGYLTVLNQTTYVPSNPISISDGTHTRMLFADNDTLWIGGTQCASGERAATGQNYNCLTKVDLGSTPTATLIPNLTPGGATTVAYPNTNGNLYYYGNLTGLCWVQTYNKVYTAYGGQIHVFSTVDGSEIDNTNVTVQGTVLDVAYMDALTNAAN